MSRYGEAARPVKEWATRRVGSAHGMARILTATVVWLLAGLGICWLMIATTGGLVADAAGSAITTHQLSKRVKDAQRAYERALKAARTELARQQKLYDNGVTEARRVLEALRDPHGQQLSRCQGVKLHERTVTTPQGTASLIGASASVDTAGNLAVTKRATLTRTVAGGLVAGPFGAVVGGAGFKKTKKLDTRELYLTINTTSFSSVVPCPPDQGSNVRSFAAKVNTAAMQAAADEPHRPARIQAAEQRLAAAKAARQPVEGAQGKVEAVAQDPSLLLSIETARDQLEEHRRVSRVASAPM
jgi:hypothetical protein